MKRGMWISAALTLAGFAATAYVWGPLFQQLPARVPIHWNLHGQADGWLPREGALPMFLLLPGMMALVTLLGWVLPWASPKKFEVDAFRSDWNLIFALVAGLMLFLHGTILYASFERQPPTDPSLAICSAILVFFIALGLLMRRLKPNYWMGVRTPWTLSSPEVWDATHRLAARSFLMGGVVGLAVIWSGLPVAWRMGGMLAVILTVSLVPVVHSLVYYKRLQRRGQL